MVLFINIYIAYLLWKCSFLPEGLFPNISYCPHHMVPHGVLQVVSTGLFLESKRSIILDL